MNKKKADRGALILRMMIYHQSLALARLVRLVAVLQLHQNQNPGIRPLRVYLPDRGKYLHHRPGHRHRYRGNRWHSLLLLFAGMHLHHPEIRHDHNRVSTSDN